MWTRRQFLNRSALSMLGAAGTALALPSESPRLAMPDGSASRGMITPETERAIARGLAFLESNQRADGSFGTNQYRGNVAVTSLAGMAFMAGGHLPGRGPYGQVVSRALDYVLAQAERAPLFGRNNPDGFLHNPNGRPQHSMYNHGFGTLFLGEVYGMVSDRRLREKLRTVLPKAVRVILKAQNREGGWRYSPVPRDADVSVTICQIMALRSAKNAGFLVPKNTVDRCVSYIRSCQNRDGSFVYQRNNRRFMGGGNQAFARSAAGVCAFYSAGIYDDPAINRGMRYLRQHRPGRSGRGQVHYFYGHYYAAQVMWTRGGDDWAAWFPSIRQELIGNQSLPDGFWVDMNCTHYGTAMASIILQIPNNYLPIMQK